MKSFEGFKSEEQVTGGYPMLPKGLYIAKITGVKIEGVEPDQRLVLRMDITEGEHANYYANRFHAEQARGGQFDPKYKGVLRLQIPDSNNYARKYPESDIRRFNGSIWAVEQSNPGYHWDWNEQGLVGKAVGINVRQGSFNGNPYTTIGRLESIPDIKAGKVKIMRDMDPRGDADAQPAAAAQDTGFGTAVDEDLPF